MQEKHTIFARHFQFDLNFVAKVRKFKGIYHVDFGFFLSGISHKRFVSQFIDQKKNIVVWLCTIQLQLSVNDRWKALCLNRIDFNVCHGSWSGPIVPKWCIATSTFKCFSLRSIPLGWSKRLTCQIVESIAYSLAATLTKIVWTHLNKQYMHVVYLMIK